MMHFAYKFSCLLQYYFCLHNGVYCFYILSSLFVVLFIGSSSSMAHLRHFTIQTQWIMCEPDHTMWERMEEITLTLVKVNMVLFVETNGSIIVSFSLSLISISLSNILWLQNGSKSKGVFTLVHKHTENLILCETSSCLTMSDGIDNNSRGWA